MIFLQILFLVLGFAMLVKGADWFVDGAAGIAAKFKIPQLITHIISGILLVLFITDVIFSLNIINSIKKIKDTVSVQVKDNTDEISSKVKAILMEKSASYKRIIVAFPQAFVDRIKNKKEKLKKINEKYLKNYTSKIKLSLMKIYNKNKE